MPLPTEMKFSSKSPLAKEFLPKMFNCAKEPPPLSKNFPASKIFLLKLVTQINLLKIVLVTPTAHRVPCITISQADDRFSPGSIDLRLGTNF